MDGGNTGGGGFRGGAGGGRFDAARYTRLVSERGVQPGYLLTGCVQSGSIMAVVARSRQCRRSPTSYTSCNPLVLPTGEKSAVAGCRRVADLVVGGYATENVCAAKHERA